MGVILVSWLETGQWLQSWREGNFANRLWGPHTKGRGAFIPCAARLLANRKAAVGSEQPMLSTQQVTELPQGTGTLDTVSWPRQRWHPAAVGSRGWFSLFGHKSQQGSLAVILTAFCIALGLSRHEGSQQGCEDCITPCYMCKLCAWKQRDNPKF